MRRSIVVSIGVLATLGIAMKLLAQEPSVPPAQMVMKADQLKWTAPPPGLPPGGSICVLDGDPSKAGLFTLRAKVPAGYAVPPHWHSCDENITVLSGKLFVGHGDQLDKSAGTAVAPGDYLKMPAKMHHFAYFEEETVFQMHGVGPFDITYINPADDPRSKAEPALSTK